MYAYIPDASQRIPVPVSNLRSRCKDVLEVAPLQEGRGEVVGEVHQTEEAACEVEDPPFLGACEEAPSSLGGLLGGQEDQDGGE